MKTNVNLFINKGLLFGSRDKASNGARECHTICKAITVKV